MTSDLARPLGAIKRKNCHIKTTSPVTACVSSLMMGWWCFKSYKCSQMNSGTIWKVINTQANVNLSTTEGNVHGEVWCHGDLKTPAFPAPSLPTLWKRLMISGLGGSSSVSENNKQVMPAAAVWVFTCLSFYQHNCTDSIFITTVKTQTNTRPCAPDYLHIKHLSLCHSAYSPALNASPET